MTVSLLQYYGGLDLVRPQSLSCIAGPERAGTSKGNNSLPASPVCAACRDLGNGFSVRRELPLVNAIRPSRMFTPAIFLEMPNSRAVT
jgi:hypothetical protein